MLVAAIVIGFWLINFIINALIGTIPPGVEKTLGSVVVPHFERQAYPSPVQSTLNELVDRLENQLPTPRDYQVLYIPEATVNALAVPGDTIVIYRGLLEAIESENELMMILGHELGHFAHRDHLRRIGRILLTQAILSSLLGNMSDLTATIAAISNARYSQAQESQADAFGLKLLNQTYGHVTGATDFFARLSKKRPDNWQFFATHPSSRQRVKQLERMSAKYGYAKGNYSPLPAVLQQPDAAGDSRSVAPSVQ
jgi:Zn-dependent protease with chaperone function